MMAQKRPQVRHNIPIRFYKIVALTFLGITILLLGVIMFMSAKRAVITVITKPDPVEMNVTIDISNQGKNIIAGMVTTTVVTITEKFSPTGSEEVDGVAEGNVTLHNETNADQPLVATTRLLSSGGILFRLEEGVTVPANGTIDAKVYADEEGREGDIASDDFTIPGLNASKQKLVYAKSNESMTGGLAHIGILDQKDLEKVQSIVLEKLEQKAIKEIFGAHSEFDEGEFEIIQHVFESDVEVGEEVSQFEIVGKATVIGVLYDGNQLDEWAKMTIVQRAISDSESIEPGNDRPVVNLESYDLIREDATLTIFYQGIATLNHESRELDKLMFYGKTKDEVRRYLLSVDHVHSVEVEFRPAWVRSVPHVSDHVNVIIKRVE